MMFVMGIVLFSSAAFAENQQVLVELEEYVDQVVYYDPLYYPGGVGTWADDHENQSFYNLTGYIVVTNTNPEGDTISDIYVAVSNTDNITLPELYDGRSGEFVSNVTSSGLIVLHIPELRANENSTWRYSINKSNIQPPLNMTSSYSASKVLAGDNVTVTDNLTNVFNNASYQSDTCIYNINLTQVTVPVNFSGTFYDFVFDNSSTTGPDASNVTYAVDNLTQYWDLWNGACFNKGNTTAISYNITTPLNIPATQSYYMVNTTLSYRFNSTLSQIRITDIKAISEANLSFDKRIVGPSDPLLYGSNVTWNVTGYFTTGTNITYNLTNVTLWVSQRNVNGSFTDPNTIDNDTISSATLYTTVAPFSLVNSSTPWEGSSWLFNYSDIPSPIVWIDVNFTIQNDGTQLINRSVTSNGTDIYIKELYLIIGYWLEIEKNVTNIGNDTYAIEITVHNKGNQVTPADTVVTIYDFMPVTFNLNGTFNYNASPWYTVTESNTSINGSYNGTLYQWALLPTNSLNTSFDQGPAVNENTSFVVRYNATGFGDYEVLDVFVTGLDPQLVDGAGSSKAVIVSEVLDRVKSTEGIFAVVASLLLLLGLLL